MFARIARPPRFSPQHAAFYLWRPTAAEMVHSTFTEEEEPDWATSQLSPDEERAILRRATCGKREGW